MTNAELTVLPPGEEAGPPKAPKTLPEAMSFASWLSVRVVDGTVTANTGAAVAQLLMVFVQGSQLLARTGDEPWR